MTELQPSPPGYRVQDEAPGPPSCPPGSYKYASHGSEAANFKSATSYSQEGYGLKQSPPRSVAPNEYYRRRNDGRRSGTENDHEGGNGGKKAAAVTGYNDGHKKNTPGYKNDCGRILESLGFTLPLNERDEASPPPTPPVRDASSLKGVCYGPGHEKYPSWPSAPERHSDEDIHSSGHSGSHRSKSWTDHTNYPKEKPAQYTRPHTKRPNPAFTQQLKTVMERCEKIPAETYESRNRSSVEEEPRLWPRVDREGKALGDAEYVVPSPPEREQQTQTLSHVDLEAYVRGYQDPQVPQVDLYRETTLTQAGLEEYTRVQHSQQASYAQSEGYHSYVSSVDSTTNTPFLDRLRRDSEAVAQRPATSWEDTSREGRDSVVTTSSGSASSSETLKWHGSMSDVSVSSGMPPRQAVSDRWHHGSMSDVSSVNGGILTQKPNNGCHEKWQSSMSDVSTSGIGTPAKGRHSLDKWQSSMNDRNKQGQGRPSLPAVIGHCTTSASISDICQTSAIRDSKWQESNLDDDSLNDRSQANQWDNSSRLENDKYTQPMPQSPTRQQVGAASPQNSENWNPIHGSMSDVSQTNGIQCSKQLIAHSARVQTPQRHHSESVLYLDRERSKRKLYPVSTTQPQESTQSSRMTLSSPPQLQLSVAERINELEKQQQQQQMRYTYLDPEKRHRVSDPTLKAIQKKALLSYYERHHQASWRSEPQLAQGPAPAPQSPQSPPPQPPPRPRPSSSRRASSASDYASGAWRENVNRTQNQGNNDLPSPKHQHSNSCSSLSTDLLGPVIVGPAISIDDWVPERPPKKPHLRNAYNERIPSPDLPPPSPPTVTESEVHDCDDPLPPPPPELSDDCFTERKSNNIHHQTEETAKINRERSCERHKSERHSIKRSKHSAKRHEIDEMSTGKIGSARLRAEDVYQQPDGTAPLFKGHKIVHLDLKGAPPKMTYYSYLFPLLRKLGATGVLVEYEDMFPFADSIDDIRAGNSYSRKDIAQIQSIARNNQLIVIPLIQTFGHMEFVLKLDKYKDFREVPRYPQVLCPTYNKTLPLIYEMINQVVSAHPTSKYLHIGADEVYQIGECSRCLDVMAKRQWSKRQLFLDHVSAVVKYIKQKYPELTVLMWDDEFRDISSQEIIDRGLHSMVEPVIWKYTTDPGMTLTDQLWESYAAVWKEVWVATAFKGATSPDRYYTDISYHMENHQRWLEIIQKYSSQITFKGVMLTGWQRYDHFSVLCELLPIGLPSLAINLAILQASDINGFPVELPDRLSEALQCDGIISLSIPEPQYGWTKCGFHGVSVYAAILRLYSLTQEITKMEQDNTYKGWLKPYNIKYSFASPSYVERAVTDLDRHRMEIMYIEKDMRAAMEDIYDNYTVQEWLDTYVAPLNERLNQLWEIKEKLLEINTWPRRPLTKSDL